LVDHLTGADDLVERASALAREIGANPAPQLRMIKDLLTRDPVETDLAEVQRRETEWLRVCWKSPEHAEAVTAFLEKRPPRFR
jgi:enoyl-CoA hydratase/carnithine racemase